MSVVSVLVKKCPVAPESAMVGVSGSFGAIGGPMFCGVLFASCLMLGLYHSFGRGSLLSYSFLLSALGSVLGMNCLWGGWM